MTALNYGSFRILGTLAKLRWVEAWGPPHCLPFLAPLPLEIAKGNTKRFANTLEISLILLTPMAVFCLMLPHNIIRLVFQRRQFTSGATDQMTTIFFYYSLSLLPFAFIRLLGLCPFARRQPNVYPPPEKLPVRPTAWFLFLISFFRRSCQVWGGRNSPRVSNRIIAGIRIGNPQKSGDLHLL